MRDTKIYWTPVLYQNNDDANILFSEPDSLFKYVLAQRESVPFSTCPAYIDMLKNTFIVRAPYDVEIILDRMNETFDISMDPSVTPYFVNRLTDIRLNDPALLTLPPRYVMYSDEEVFIQVLPMMMNREPVPWNIIPGTYDISKWIRPMEFTAEFLTKDNVINIKRGDPLFCLKFVTKDNSKVVFERVEYDFAIERTMLSCTGIKRKIQNVPLQTLYKLAENFIDMFKKNRIGKKSKCPFHF